MTRERRASRAFTLLAVTAVAAVIAPTGAVAPTGSVAAWPDTERVHGTLGTSSYRCGTDIGYSAGSEGRLLSGSLLGLDLDAVAALNGMSLEYAGSAPVSASPAAPPALVVTSADPDYTYANPLSATALQTVDAGLSPLVIPASWADLGAADQRAHVSGYGDAWGAAGLVDDSGVVTVGALPADDVPDPARLSLSAPLGAADRVDLEIGAVGASAAFDGCAALRSLVWGDGSVSGVARDYGIASLGLDLDSPAVSSLVAGVSTTVLPGIQSSFNGLTGANGAIAQLFRNRILGLGSGVLGALSVGNVTGTATLTFDFSGVTALLQQPIDGAGVRVDLAEGTIEIDLETFVGELNDRPPNSELVLDASVVDAIVTSIGAALATRQAQLTAAIQSAVDAAVLDVQLSVALRSPSLLGGTIPATNILRVDLTANATLATLAAGGLVVNLAVVDTAGGLLGTILSLLGLTLGTLTAAITGLAGGLADGIEALVNPVASSAVSLAVDQVTALVSEVSAAVSTVLAPLSSVLSVIVNVQSTLSPPSGTTTAAYLEAALRIGVLNDGDVASLTLARAIVGPISAP